MNSVELVKKICKERNIAISKLERDCGFGNGYIRGLREGKFPSDRLAKIADYLGVSINYLATGSENNLSIEDALLDVRISEDSELKEAIKKYYTLDNEKKKYVLGLIHLLYED